MSYCKCVPSPTASGWEPQFAAVLPGAPIKLLQPTKEFIHFKPQLNSLANPSTPLDEPLYPVLRPCESSSGLTFTAIFADGNISAPRRRLQHLQPFPSPITDTSVIGLKFIPLFVQLRARYFFR